MHFDAVAKLDTGSFSERHASLESQTRRRMFIDRKKWLWKAFLPRKRGRGRRKREDDRSWVRTGSRRRRWPRKESTVKIFYCGWISAVGGFFRLSRRLQTCYIKVHRYGLCRRCQRPTNRRRLLGTSYSHAMETDRFTSCEPNGWPSRTRQSPIKLISLQIHTSSACLLLSSPFAARFASPSLQSRMCRILPRCII